MAGVFGAIGIVLIRQNFRMVFQALGKDLPMRDIKLRFGFRPIKSTLSRTSLKSIRIGFCGKESVHWLVLLSSNCLIDTWARFGLRSTLKIQKSKNTFAKRLICLLRTGR